MTYYENICQKSALKSAWKKLHKHPQSVGLDKVTVAEFRTDLDENLEEIRGLLESKKYKPVKLLPYMLKKPEGGYRVLRIPAVRDRVIQRAILDEITPALEKRFGINKNGVSYAYTNGGGVKRAALELVKYWEQGYCFAFKADIIKFFDNINKEKLLGMISDALGDDKSLMDIIEMQLNCELENIQKVAEYDPTLYNPKPLIGIAQGSPLSPVFANVYLAEFDKTIICRELKMIRYADDLIIMTKTLEDAENVHNIVSTELAKLGLGIHQLKTQGQLPTIAHSRPKFSEARKCQDLTFLGLTFKSKKIYPAGRSYQNAAKSVRFAAYDTGTTFVKKLVSIDARVSGWAAAYSFTEREPAKLANLDKQLDQIIGIMLNKQGLRIKRRSSPHTVVGIPNYTSVLQKIDNKKQKKSKNNS